MIVLPTSSAKKKKKDNLDVLNYWKSGGGRNEAGREQEQSFCLHVECLGGNV